MILRRLTIIITFLTAWVWSNGQQINAVPDYVFRNQMSVGRNAVTDTAAYFSIGPRYGANKGFMPPIVGDTATFSSGKRNGLLIFSVQKNKFLYWDSVRVQWSDMAGSSGSYITGSGITGYLPQFSASTTLDTSALFTLGNRLGIGSSTFAYNSTNTANVELNGTAGGILGFKRNDSARGYLWHTGDNMELANTAAGSIFFNTNSATRGSISSAGVWRLHNLAGTGDRVVVASSNGTLSAASSATALVDTTTISTRAWRQKGLDSLAALEVSGSGTTNYVPKFTAGSTIGNSIIQDNGTDVGIGSNSAGARLEILRTATGAANNNTTGSVFGSLHGSGGGPSDYGFAIRHNASAYAGISGSNFVAQLVSSSTNSNALEMYTTGATPLVLGTSATERLRITSGGDVGIGTSSPSEKLDVSGFIRTTSGVKVTDGTIDFRLSWASGNVGFFGNISNHPIDFYTNAAQRMRIFANGRIGINTTTDAGYQLDVNGTFRAQGGSALSTSVFSNTGFDGGIDISNTGTLAANRTAQIRITNGTTFFGANDRSYQLINIGESATAAAFAVQYYNGTTFSERLRINSSGNVGIGTASPLYKMHVLNQAGESSLFLESGTTTQAALYLANANNAIYNDNSTTNNLKFFVNSATRMTINSAGEILINTTTDAGDYKLQVAGTIYANNPSSVALQIGGGQAIRTTGALYVDYGTAGSGDLVFRGGSGFANVLTATNAGKIGMGVTNPDGVLELLGGTLTAGTVGTYALLLGNSSRQIMSLGTDANYGYIQTWGSRSLNLNSQGNNTIINSGSGEVLIGATSDAGDYKLQVVGNARVGSGKLDIATTTTFGIGVARSGTSEVAGQIYNSNGILYLGAESSAGGQIFSGSSAYAAVIGSGANYPLQFASNNITRATINTNGELLINTLTDNGDFKLQVNGSALISGSIQTANPVSGTAVPWRLGSVVATNVQLDTGNYVEVNINGTFYRLAIVTPL